MSTRLLPILNDAKSLVRPYYRRAEGAARASLNDLSRAVGASFEVDEPLRQQWLRVLRNSDEVLAQIPPASGPRVLFATGYGLADAMMTIESILVMALRLRGASPVVLRCDKTLPACEWNRHGNFDPDPGAFGPQLTRRTRLDRCRVCTAAIEDTHGVLPVDQVAFSDHLRPGDLERVTGIVDGLAYEQYRDFVYRDIPVGEHAYSSTVRSLLRGTLTDDEETRWLFRRYLVSSILVTDLTERVLEREKPDHLVAIHGIYVTHGTICDVARKHGVNVVVYGTPYRKGTIWLSHDDTYHRTLITEPTELWEEMELTPERAKRVDDYLAEKRFAARDYAAYHKDAVNDVETVMAELGLDAERPIVSIFTNVLWDAQLYYKYNAFGNMMEWLFETIRYFERRQDLQLVIRIHPAEASAANATNQPLLAEIEREFPHLAGNVKIVRPESKLSSYTLAEISRAALIYGARMGVEIAALGIPLVVAGETFNRRKGYSYDVETREEYFRLLDRIQTLPRNSEETVERARKYAYHYYYRLMMDFPLFSVQNGIHMSEPRLEFSHLDALLPGASGALDVVCQGIMDGETPFIYDSLGSSASLEAAHA
jgi:hypothetical protein